MSASIGTLSVFRCVQSVLTCLFVSICLFLLSILTYVTLRKHLMPVSHLIIPVPFGLPSNSAQPPTDFPAYLVSRVNLSDTFGEHSSLDIASHAYRIDFECHSPRSYINRQLGSFFVQLALHSNTGQLIVEHSRLILFPYQSDIVRLIRTVLLLPLSLVGVDHDRWHFEQTLVDRLTSDALSKRFMQVIQLNIYPPSFQLDQCRLHFHVLDLTGLVYSFIHYPILTSCLSTVVLFVIYMTFYLLIASLSVLNQMTRKDVAFTKEE